MAETFLNRARANTTGGHRGADRAEPPKPPDSRRKRNWGEEQATDASDENLSEMPRDQGTCRVPPKRALS